MRTCLQVVLLQDAIAAIAAINSINSPPLTLVMVDDGEQATAGDDEINLLQEKAIVANNHKQDPEINMEGVEQIPAPLFDRVTMEQAAFGSYLSNDKLHCIQGPYEETELKHSMIRTTPLSVFYSSEDFAGGVTCAQRGYTDVAASEHECMPSQSRWSRPGSPTERLTAGGPLGGLWADAFDNYDASHGYASGTSKTWVGCFICTDDSVVRTAGSWGQLDCDNHPDNVLAGIRSRPGGMASLASVGDEVCFEAPREYLESRLEHTLTTPMGVLFAGQGIQDVDCTSRGFDKVRDMIDECWSQSSKHIREHHENTYMINWIAAYHGSMSDYDSRSLSGGRWSSVDWVSCRACDLGGAVRDRGMWQTMHGGDSIPYSDAYCDAMHFPTDQLTFISP